ncbi:unnamed protein product [Camellia sinensis]
MASAMFRLIGALGRNMIVANVFGSFTLLAVLILGGFILSRDDIKKWWLWVYWFSPRMYAQNAIAVNEFLGNSWRNTFVDEVMELVELTPLSEALVGLPGANGLSIEQRKREVTSLAQEAVLGVNFADVYNNSELYRKQQLSYWRNPPYAAVRFLFVIFIALLFGTIFWDLGSKRETQQDIFNAMGSMYAAVLFLGVQNASSVQPVVAIERTVFYRERTARIVVIELPYIFIQTLMYRVIVYAMIRFEWTVAKFLCKNSGVVEVVLLHLPSLLDSLWNGCFTVWRRSRTIDTGGTVEEFIRNYFDFKHDFVGYVAVIIVGIVVLFGFIFAYSIKAFNF